MKIAELMEILNAIAPFDTQEEWDNAGLLVGSGDMEVTNIHLELDPTEAAVNAAKANGANVLLTHHPILFSPIRRIDYDLPEHRAIIACIKADIALIAMHTNWDKAPGGVSDTLAARMGLRNVTAIDDFLRIGDLAEAMAAEAFCAKAEALLRTRMRAYIPADIGHISRVAVGPGGSGSSYLDAFRNGAQAFISGEIKHHEAVDSYALGMLTLECGHFETEHPAMEALAAGLQKRLDSLQYKALLSVGQSFAGGARIIHV